MTDCLLNLVVGGKGQFHTTLPLRSSWNRLSWVRRFHLTRLCCVLWAVFCHGKIHQQSCSTHIINYWGQNNDLSLKRSHRESVQKGLTDVIFLLKPRLRCEYKWHRSEILCWLLCCGRFPLNERAIFCIWVKVIFFLALDYHWKLNHFP